MRLDVLQVVDKLLKLLDFLLFKIQYARFILLFQFVILIYLNHQVVNF